MCQSNQILVQNILRLTMVFMCIDPDFCMLPQPGPATASLISYVKMRRSMQRTKASQWLQLGSSGGWVCQRRSCGWCSSGWKHNSSCQAFGTCSSRSRHTNASKLRMAPVDGVYTIYIVPIVWECAAYLPKAKPQIMEPGFSSEIFFPSGLSGS